MMKRVESSTIKGITYIAKDMQLVVYFHDESVYVYGAVPKEIYESFLHANSVGSYYNRFIRNDYPVIRKS